MLYPYHETGMYSHLAKILMFVADFIIFRHFENLPAREVAAYGGLLLLFLFCVCFTSSLVVSYADAAVAGKQPYAAPSLAGRFSKWRKMIKSATNIKISAK